MTETISFENLTSQQTYFLWLNMHYVHMPRGLIHQCYVDIQSNIYRELKVIWGYLPIEEQIEIQNIQALCNAIKDICIVLHDSAADDKWLATVKI